MDFILNWGFIHDVNTGSSIWLWGQRSLSVSTLMIDHKNRGYGSVVVDVIRNRGKRLDANYGLLSIDSMYIYIIDTW